VALKSYFAIEEGLLGEKVFAIEEHLTIGRKIDNDIHLSDRTVSKKHAIVYRRDGQCIVEDLGSFNGTFVNGEQIKKAVLVNGDKIQIGKVKLRFFQEDESTAQIDLKDTHEFTVTRTDDSHCSTPSRSSRRVIEAISKVPLFLGLNEEALRRIGQAVQLVTCDQGKTIIEQGEWGDSLYVILDGKVRVFTYDDQGGEVLLGYLSENQFFGEISLLIKVPRTAMVQAEQDTLLGKLSFQAVRQIMQEFPIVKAMLEQYQRERLQELEKNKNIRPFERRRHPRYQMELEARFSVSPASGVSIATADTEYSCITTNISISGVRVKVKEPSLLELPVGCQLRMEILLPAPWDSIRCIGTLRNLSESSDEEHWVYLGVEFTNILTTYQKRLERFLFEHTMNMASTDDSVQFGE